LLYKDIPVNKIFSHVHSVVKREGAEHYLLYSLLSFAASVSLTRLFLELTGYPQLATAELHIAHVLWGGLLLFIAALLPLVIANRWVYTAGGLLSGAGVGLFIDEVGKFITQTNDYFYPPAAPIIYAFFLLVVLFYLRVRRPPREDPRAELYRAFDTLQEVLDHALDKHERAALVTRLERIIERAEHPNHVALARSLLAFLEAETFEAAPSRLSLEDRVRRWRYLLMARYLRRPIHKSLLIVSLLLMSMGALVDLSFLLVNRPSLEEAYVLLLGNGDEVSANMVFLYLARIGLESLLGVLWLVSALLLLVRRDYLGVTVGYFGLLIALTVLNLLVFYFDQFSAIITATIQFLLLMGLILYRQHHLAPLPEGESEAVQVEE
jgi:hypothetical protein